jgi:hypothetical protein
MRWLIGGCTALVALVAFAAPQAGARGTCTPGVKTVNGVTMRTFCGPAKATVHYGAKTFTFAQGRCDKTKDYVAVNIGTVVLGQTSKPKPEYFGLVVGKLPLGGGGTPAAKDGTYTNGTLVFDHGGKAYLVNGTTLRITLKGGRTRGTFSGSGLGAPAPKITGTFSCR